MVKAKLEADIEYDENLKVPRTRYDDILDDAHKEAIDKVRRHFASHRENEEISVGLLRSVLDRIEKNGRHAL